MSEKFNTMDLAHILILSLFTLSTNRCLGQEASTTGNTQVASFAIELRPNTDQLLAQQDSNRVLTCVSTTTADGRTPLLHWEFGEVKITSTSTSDRIRVESVSDKDLRLRLENVKKEDAGTYKCVGTLDQETNFKNILFQVYDDIKLHSPKEQFGLLGQLGEVKCNVTGTPTPTVLWKFSNMATIENSEKYSVQNNKLIITNLTFDDDQTYICDVTMTLTASSQQYDIRFEVVKLPVIEKKPVIEPDSPPVGQKVTITCQADGRPQPTYQFKKDGELLPEDQVDKVLGKLTLDDVKETDEGTYTCVATNRGGSEESSIFLDVKVPPTIRDMPNEREVDENDFLELTCIADGDPSPIVKWEKEGSENADLNLIDVLGDEPDNNTATKTLKFAQVEPKHAGSYVCKAISVVGSANRTVKLDVKFAPKFNTDYNQKSFYGWNGHTANLTCQASAHEPAEIEWYKSDPTSDSGILLETSDSYTLGATQQNPDSHLSSRSLLVKVGEDPSVYGVYYCEAKNSLNFARQEVELFQALAPNEPIVEVTQVLTTMVVLDIKPPSSDGGQPISSYSYSYHPANDSTDVKDGNVDYNGPTTRVELRNLSPKTEYIVSVKAKNVVGEGYEQTVSFETKEVSKPLPLNMTSPREGSDAKSFKIVWSEPETGGSAILKFVIRYKKVDVEDEGSSEWRVSESHDTNFTEKTLTDPEARSYVIHDLEENSFYEVRILAINDHGESDEETTIIKTSQSSKQLATTETVGLGSGGVIGIVLTILVVVIIVAIFVFLIARKPEVLNRLRGLGGKGGEEERGKGDDGKDPAEEEKLIKKEDIVKVENETEETKPEEVVGEEQQQEFEPDSKPDVVQPTSAVVTTDKAPELATPTATTEIKITPETPEKPENPAA